MPTPADLLGVSRPHTLTEVRTLLSTAKSSGIEYKESPKDWRDEILYFLLPDRFSDGKESTRPLLTRSEIINLRQTTDRPGWRWDQWAQSGRKWQGGTINGIRSKLNYLKDLGITTIWVGPIFKQRTRVDSYHGYGIQDFLDVDPRFGTREDLINLVAEAHNINMWIILDVIFNHSGDNWGYVRPGDSFSDAINEPPYLDWPNYYGNPSDPDKRNWRTAWRNEQQQGYTDQASNIRSDNEGVWPEELQDFNLYTRAGKGDLGIGNVGDADAQHKRTDFFALKDFALDVNNTLTFLTECFKYWIALTDCDGFRIDTLKHVSLEEARNFCGSIGEFAESIGKHNFFLVAEIAGSDEAADYYLDRIAILKRNLSAALDIDSARVILESVGKGLSPGGNYLGLFKENSDDLGSHRSVGKRHVSILDDHDHVSGQKLRFSALIPDDLPTKDYQVVAATAFQLFTLGIPCIYSGTEQAFAGPAQSQLRYLIDQGWNNPNNYGDRYLRETMFGPNHPRADFNNDLANQLNNEDTSLPGFGAFGTTGKHCFDPISPSYVRLAALCKVRAEIQALRTGRQYQRQIRLPGTGFDTPKTGGELVAWSRILSDQEAICIVNPNGNAFRGGDIVVSAELWTVGSKFTVVANTAQAANPSAAGISHHVGSIVKVQGLRSNEPAFIEIRNVPPAEVLVLIQRR
jgi:glycosidase